MIDIIKAQFRKIKESSSSQIAMMNFPRNRTDAYLLIEMKKLAGNHDLQIRHIFEAIENLRDENIEKERWEKRNGLVKSE